MKYLVFFLLFVGNCYAHQQPNLDKVIATLVKVESNGNPKLVGDHGRAYGLLQIHSCVIRDVNVAYGWAFTHKDAFDPQKAIKICKAYLSLHGKGKDFEGLCRLWNGGPTLPKSATNGYWAKVKKAL